MESPNNQSNESTTSDLSLAQLGITGKRSDHHAQELLKKIKLAARRVNSENDTPLTEDELINLIRVWEPQRDIICLYVRWARQLRRNFNLDSIATLLCLSRQCGYTPVDFLCKVKTLSIYKNDKSCFGVSFHFDIPNRKDLNRERLNKEFHGLSVTLALLQEQVNHSSSILGKTGRRQSPSMPRMANTVHIPLDNKDKDKKDSLDVISPPTIEFHTQSSLMNRIWLSLNHRWLALYTTEHLFREVNETWSHHEALVYSFQMMASSGPCRFEFLSPLVGYCLRFSTYESIASQRTRLIEIWSDPSSFLPYGKTCLSQFSTDAQTRIICDCFHALHSEIPTVCKKQISYNRDACWTRRWTMLRAYVFHFWLDSTANGNIKLNVTNNVMACRKRTKRKFSDQLTANQNQTPTPLPISTNVAKKNPRTSKDKLINGLQSIISSRCGINQSQQKTPMEESSPSTSVVHNHVPSPNIMNDSRNHHPIPSWLSDKNFEWKAFRLVTQEEMQRYIQSYLLVHRSDGVDILSELSPLEVYSADHLHDWVHCRTTGTSPFYPTKKTGPVVLHIHADADRYIDISSKSFHIARERCEYFEEYSLQLPPLDKVQTICQAIVCYGSMDSKRATGQYRLNMGNGGQNWVNGAPCQLHGLQFKKKLEADEKFDADDVLISIGKLTEFTWQVMCALQNDASDHPIAPDKSRKQLYAAHLNEYLSMDADVGFEDLTLVVSSLHPAITDVTDHKDVMNDTAAGYTRTGCFSLVLMNDSHGAPTLIHFQVICNFRKVISQFVNPFHRYLLPVGKHARQYLEKWHRNMHSVYAGRTKTIPSAYDRTKFFLDDLLPYSVVAISEDGRHKQSLSGEYLLTEVNPSRTLSLSMFIYPIVQLQSYLKFDQTIELAFACSFLSNPFWFDWTMSSLIQRQKDPSDPFTIGLHPFYDWSHATIKNFGTWQGGPYNRWSPCGGTKESIIETFGADPGSTKEEREEGQRKLSLVIGVLWKHIQWINSMSDCGMTPTIDMPLTSMKARCDQTIQEIATIASCQFSHFRLGILVTILSGCGLLKEGKHLRHCMYPVKGSASHKHLSCPVGDVMSTQRAQALVNNQANESVANDGEGVVHEDNHDVFMQHLSAELGFQVYLRDEIECILCESHPMRSLHCRDWFRKGISLFDCNKDGEFFRRDYGRETSWVKLSPPEQYDFAFLKSSTIQYIPLDATLAHYAAEFGKELRKNSSTKVRFQGRQSRTSNQKRTFINNYQSDEKYSHTTMRVANFYVGSHLDKSESKVTSMFVLEDSQGAIETNDCNNLDDFHFGTLLHRHLHSLNVTAEQWSRTSVAAGCWHMDFEQNNEGQATFFPGHVDKHFVHSAWFVPLGQSISFTLLSVPADDSQHLQDNQSLQIFNNWISGLPMLDSQQVNSFLSDFDVQSKKLRQNKKPRKTLIFVNRCGSFLSFPANHWYHATITPAKTVGCTRDLFIFHPLDGMSL